MPDRLDSFPLLRVARAAVPWLMLALVAGLLAAWARFTLIEPLATALACQADPGPWHCRLRSLVVASFQGQRIGWAGLGLAALAGAWSWSAGPRTTSAPMVRILAAAGLVLGAAAALWYAVEPGVVAMLVALAVLVRTGVPVTPLAGGNR